MDSSQRALHTEEKPFFKLLFEILAENQKIFNGIARREYRSNSNVLYIWIRFNYL